MGVIVKKSILKEQNKAQVEKKIESNSAADNVRALINEGLVNDKLNGGATSLM